MSDLDHARKGIEEIVRTTDEDHQATKVAGLKSKYPEIEEIELLKMLFEARKQAEPNLATLLDRILEYYQKYMAYCSVSQAVTITLWTASTHVFEQFEQSPYLNINSPEMRCGKTRQLDTAELFVARPWRVVAPTEAVLFRKIENDRPTVLFDEIDTVFRNGKGDFEAVRALLNAGNRAGTTVPRCVGTKLEIRDFSVYCPKAFAGIGDKLPSTVKDRSITIKLARKKPNETVMRFRQREAAKAAEPLRAQLERWAETADLSEARPEIPDELDDRAQDSWEPLLAIADSAGGDWPERARKAALELSAGRFDQDDSFGSKLLQDIRGVFEEKKADRFSSEELIEVLVAIEEAPWGEYYGKPITARSVARLLKPYGIESKTHRFGEETAKGYLRADFSDAWARYLPPAGPNSALKRNMGNIAVQGVTLKNTKGNIATQAVNASTSDVTDSETKNSASTSNVTDVTDKGVISKGRGKNDAQFHCSNCGKRPSFVFRDGLYGTAPNLVCRKCWDILEEGGLKNA